MIEPLRRSSADQRPVVRRKVATEPLRKHSPGQFQLQSFIQRQQDTYLKRGTIASFLIKSPAAAAAMVDKHGVILRAAGVEGILQGVAATLGIQRNQKRRPAACLRHSGQHQHADTDREGDNHRGTDPGYRLEFSQNTSLSQGICSIASGPETAFCQYSVQQRFPAVACGLRQA